LDAAIAAEHRAIPLVYWFMPTIKALDEKLLKGLPPGTWVAVSEDQERIVGTGATIEEALRQADQKAEKNPFIIGIPDDRSALIL